MTRAIAIDRYRTIGILASQDAGRTTTTERLLSIAEPAEMQAAGRDERAITVTSAATSCDWNGCRLNFVQLPVIGRPMDEAALAAVDAVVVVVDAERGVTAEVSAALALAATRGLARLVFVNKLDRAGVDLDAIVVAVPAGVAFQLPIGAGAGLAGLVDLVALNAQFWRDGQVDGPAETGPVPADLAGAAAAAHARLVGAAEPADLAGTLRAAVRAGSLVPVFCGSAFRNRGIRRLLDAIVAYLPAPSDIAFEARSTGPDAAQGRATDEAPFAGLAFRTVTEPSAGRLTFVRVFSGVAVTGDRLFNTASCRAEKIGAMVRIHANHIAPVDEARTGDIVALVGLDHTASGDTICDPAAPVTLGAVRPRSAA